MRAPVLEARRSVSGAFGLLGQFQPALLGGFLSLRALAMASLSAAKRLGSRV
jgi:hypothetical protein